MRVEAALPCPHSLGTSGSQPSGPRPPRGITVSGLAGVGSRPGPLPDPKAPRPRHDDCPHAGTFRLPAVCPCPGHFLATQCLCLLSSDPLLSVPPLSSLPSHLPSLSDAWLCHGPRGKPWPPGLLRSTWAYLPRSFLPASPRSRPALEASARCPCGVC